MDKETEKLNEAQRSGVPFDPFVRCRAAPRFKTTYCSQCGREFGPGNHGFSHCKDHRREKLRLSKNGNQILPNEVGVIISQFLLYMQQKSIWPCHLFIGDDPQQITPDESNKLKDEFKLMLTETVK